MKTAKTPGFACLGATRLIGMKGQLLAEQPGTAGYLSFDGGLAVQRTIGIKDSDGDRLSFDRGLRFDVAVGCGTREPNSMAVELELGLTYNSTKPIASLDSERLDVYEVPILLNAIYTLPLRGPVRAYAGIGVGGVYGIFVGRDTSILGFNTDITFGFQGTAGIDYHINDEWTIGVAYKFLGTTDH